MCSGIPDNPAAWITTVAYRRLIDARRRERTRREKQALVEYELAMEASEEPIMPESLFSEYLLPFEIASVLLLVAVVGSVVMAKKRI